VVVEVVVVVMVGGRQAYRYAEGFGRHTDRPADKQADIQVDSQVDMTERADRADRVDRSDRADRTTRAGATRARAQCASGVGARFGQAMSWMKWFYDESSFKSPESIALGALRQSELKSGRVSAENGRVLVGADCGVSTCSSYINISNVTY
jgi:hypothetical protein